MRACILAAAAALFAVFGCGSSTGTISGTVSYEGAPLKGGHVIFLVGGKSFNADIGEDGGYSVSNVPAGEAKISVDTMSLARVGQIKFKNTPPEGAKAPPGYKMADPEEASRRYVAIPKKFADPEQSGLKLTIKGGKQTYEIKLTGALSKEDTEIPADSNPDPKSKYGGGSRPPGGGKPQ